MFGFVVLCCWFLFSVAALNTGFDIVWLMCSGVVGWVWVIKFRFVVVCFCGC